jgi:hypothetical protein
MNGRSFERTGAILKTKLRLGVDLNSADNLIIPQIRSSQWIMCPQAVVTFARSHRHFLLDFSVSLTMF